MPNTVAYLAAIEPDEVTPTDLRQEIRASREGAPHSLIACYRVWLADEYDRVHAEPGAAVVFQEGQGWIIGFAWGADADWTECTGAPTDMSDPSFTAAVRDAIEYLL